MIGIFDSGIGGFTAYYQLKRLMPRGNIVYLADRKNAPYGTKSEDEIICYSKRNIERLRQMGAEKILIACCTASGIYEKLSEDERKISIPIIMPTAIEVAKSAQRIVVIATNRTVSSKYFSREISKYSNAQVMEIPTQELVALVEGGCRDGRINPKCLGILKEIQKHCLDFRADSLILGCTHFSHLEGELSKLLPQINIISPAKIGAQKIAKEFLPSREGGRIVYT